MLKTSIMVDYSKCFQEFISDTTAVKSNVKLPDAAFFSLKIESYEYRKKGPGTIA